MQTNEHEGRRLLDGRYEVVAVLGGGGSAIVYLARHHALFRDVAIKVIRPEVFESERELERYLREARIIASLNHPNIVTLHDVGKLGDGRPYMVMEYVNGQSLNRLLAHDATLPVDTALAVFEQVARALGHAHRNGIVHRDIKPGNILLRQRSTGYPMVKVADFGVASVASASMTHQGAFIGTPLYMSPEQAQGHPVSPASDIYSLGILMYRALTGRKPFDAESPIALALRHVTDPVPPMQGAVPDLSIPSELEAVVLKCLEKDPADRYHTADELLEALTEVHVAVAPHLIGLSQESLDASTSGGIRIVTVPQPARAVTPARAAIGILTLAALGLGVAVGWAVRQPVVVGVPVAPHPMVIEVAQPAPPPVVPAPVAQTSRPVQVQVQAPVAPAVEPEVPSRPVVDTASQPGQSRKRVRRSVRSPDGRDDVAPAGDPDSVWGG